VLDGANGAHQNHRIPSAKSRAITDQMQEKSKAVSAFLHGSRVDIPSGKPAVNADGTLKAPTQKKKKTLPTAAHGKKKAVTTSPDGKTVSMSKGHWRTKLQEAAVLKREKHECEAKIITLKEDLMQNQKALTALTEHKNGLVTQNRDCRMELADLQSLIKAIRAKNGGKSTKDERSSDITKEIGTFVKDNLFRTIKFAQPGQEMSTATQRVWNGIKGRLKLEEPPKSLNFDEFYRIYHPVVQTELSLARQYVQSRSQDAAHCK